MEKLLILKEIKIKILKYYLNNRMSNKKYLIKKLLEYPEISNNEYISLVHKKNKIIKKNYNDDNNELDNINQKIELYNEKMLLINLIKNPYI